jgi:hypothetical protein
MEQGIKSIDDSSVTVKQNENIALTNTDVHYTPELVQKTEDIENVKQITQCDGEFLNTENFVDEENENILLPNVDDQYTPEQTLNTEIENVKGSTPCDGEILSLYDTNSEENENILLPNVDDQYTPGHTLNTEIENVQGSAPCEEDILSLDNINSEEIEKNILLANGDFEYISEFDVTTNNLKKELDETETDNSMPEPNLG